MVVQTIKLETAITIYLGLQTPGTAKAYSWALCPLVKEYRSLSDIDAKELQAFIENKWGSYSESTRKLRITAFRSFFTWAVSEQLIGANPASSIEAICGDCSNKFSYELRKGITNRQFCDVCKAKRDKERKKAYKIRYREKYLNDASAYATRKREDPKVREQQRLEAARRRAENPEHERELQRRSYWNNVDERRIQAREYREANPEKQKQAGRRWYEKKGRLYAEKRRRAKGILPFRPAAPGAKTNKARFYNAQRQKRLKNQFVEKIDRFFVFERDAGMCRICGYEVEEWDFHIDHVIPIARGGEHSYANVSLAHPRCNLQKKDQILKRVS